MITPSYGLTATERVLPRLALDWTTGLTQPGVDVVRAGVATFVGSNGLIQSATADSQRVDYLTGTPGLLVEESRTNLIINSALSGGTSGTPGTAPTNWTQATVGVATGTYALDDEIAFTGFTYEINAAVSGRLMANQIIIVLANTSYFVSVTVDIASGTEQIFNYFVIPSSPVGSTTAYYLDNVSVAQTAVPSVGRHTIAILLTVAATAGTAQLRMGVGTVLAPSAAASVTFRRPQFEAGAFPTSYIPTAGSPVTRNADLATMTGTNFSDFYNATEGGVVVHARPYVVTGTRPAVQFDDNTADELIALRGVAADPQLFVVDGGVTQATLDAGTIAANTLYKLGGAWKDASYAVALNGAAPVTQSSGTFPTATQARLGSDGTNYLNGHLQSLRFWSQRLTNAEVQAFSK